MFKIPEFFPNPCYLCLTDRPRCPGLCMAAQVLGAIGNLLAGVYLDQMSQWAWLGLYIPTQTLANGPFIMTTYSFIADNSTPRFI